MVELSKSCDLEQVGKDAMSEFLSRLGKDRVAQENLEQLFGELAYKMVRNISGPVTQDVRFQMASSFLPQNWGKELNNIASTNFSKTMKLLADGTRNLTNALQAELYNQDGDDNYDCYNYGNNCLTKYQEKAATMHVVTQVFDILSEVQWGSEPYIKPDGSSFGQFLAELQPFIERSLEDMEMRKKAAESCIILANRMAATDFSWCYTTYYGRECVDANPQTRTATAYVINSVPLSAPRQSFD
eukprot:CAMPEP_0119120548 /NCGR_PEP_ID=MMETSP1310-20130426/1537_1 /TAXON_ID=464262 /ORGANISM="Genus nov. species nov., Strain RCC2339" /LENGTH=242 /DNA_ID=CAMNT_0007110029 /DNA_START=319 /DNA_END=1045 /DNA_ORIENTATION=+